MKPLDELRSAFPPPDERFVTCVRHTLDTLPQEEVKTMKHTKLRTGLLIAAALLILSTIGVAAAGTRYGLFDFLSGYSEGDAPRPEVSSLVQDDVSQTGGKLEDLSISYSLREAVYDGHYVHMVVEAKPASDQTLLIGPDCMLKDQISFLGLDGEQTVAEYARSNGKTDIQRISLYDQAAARGENGVVSSMDYRLESDGTLVFILSGPREDGAEALPVELICSSSSVNLEDDSQGEPTKTTLSFTLNRSDEGQQTCVFSTPFAFDDCGVTLERVTLQSTPMGIYYTMDCVVTDPTAYASTEDGVTFGFLDDAGEYISMAPGTGGECSLPSEDGRFTITGTLQSDGQLPASVTIQCYNCWTKDSYGTATLQSDPE